jgi:hypothetical protein
MEMSDEEFTMIKSFIVDDLGNGVDWDNVPEEFKNKYTEVVQIMNAFGAEQEEGTAPEMAAPA